MFPIDFEGAIVVIGRLISLERDAFSFVDMWCDNRFSWCPRILLVVIMMDVIISNSNAVIISGSCAGRFSDH